MVLAAAGVSFHVLLSWHFNPRDLDWHQLHTVAMWMFFGDLSINQWIKNVLLQEPSQIQKLIKSIQHGYIASNPYHSWFHAMDVTHHVYFAMRNCSSNSYFNVQERFGLILAAMAHDIGHPGYNNPFLVETSDELALRYNDKSPLENMHCARLFQMAVQNPDTAILTNLTKPLYSEVRRVCVEAIFHTDMVHHFAMVKDIQMLYEVNSETIGRGWAEDRFLEDAWIVPAKVTELFKHPDNRKTLRNLMLHIADISNSMKPFILCRQWAYSVLDEFFLQGDSEKELGIPVQMLNDRDKVNRPFSQLGFIEFIVSPLAFATMRIFPPMTINAEQLTINARQWQAEWLESTDPTDQEETSMQNRLAKLEQTFQESIVEK